MYEEIQKTIGSRSVSWKDREDMHYTQGFIHEVLRCGGIAGMTLPHKCTADTVIGGHIIPEGSVVLGNLYSTFYDESVFPDSYSFKPERYLNEEGKFVKPTGKQMLPLALVKEGV
ncbi:CYP2E1 [Bugula neritina]|uniref:CYP2E1 n=1 Tax=Bugula neritina TaxID=10212 RepID=A0A7J7JBY5_BUGNE|nr:CYP2E1 [Bugula neritina]